MVWMFSKQMRRALSALQVDLRSVDLLKDLLKTKKVVLMPIYRSVADIFIFVYIHHCFGIEAPFMFGN